MPSRFFSLVTPMACAAAVHTEEVDLEKVVDSLIGGETAHTKLAGGKGFRAASISVLGNDALVFEPNTVNEKSFGATCTAKVL